jgi:hypothetical protein
VRPSKSIEPIATAEFEREVASSPETPPRGQIDGLSERARMDALFLARLDGRELGAITSLIDSPEELEVLRVETKTLRGRVSAAHLKLNEVWGPEAIKRFRSGKFEVTVGRPPASNPEELIKCRAPPDPTRADAVFEFVRLRRGEDTQIDEAWSTRDRELERVRSEARIVIALLAK